MGLSYLYRRRSTEEDIKERGEKKAEMIETVVLMFVERPSWMLTEDAYARHEEIKITALRHKGRQIAIYYLKQQKTDSLQSRY